MTEPHICPLCQRPWEPIEGLVSTNDQLFWNGRRLPLTPPQVAIFNLLYAKQGTVVRTTAIYDELYPISRREPASPAVVKVWISRLRQVLDSYNIPLSIPRRHKSWGYILVARDGR